MSEEYLRNYPRGASKLFIAGYILRIIPVANIIGAVLTAIGYYRLWSKWIKYALIALGVIGSILVVAAASIYVYSGLLSPVSQPGLNIGTSSTRDALIKTIDTVIDQMSKWYTIIPPIIIGVGLVFEALALHGIRSYIGSAMPRYVVIIVFIYGFLEVLQPVAVFATIPRLRSLREELVHSTSYIQPATIAFKLLAALMPVLVMSVIIFITALLAYILLAYRFHTLSKLSKEAALLRSTGGEAEEEVVI